MTRTGETRALLEHKELPPPSVVKGIRSAAFDVGHQHLRGVGGSGSGCRDRGPQRHARPMGRGTCRAGSDLVLSSKPDRRSGQPRRSAAPKRLLLADGPRWAQPSRQLPSRRRRSPIGDGGRSRGSKHDGLSWSSRWVVRHNGVRTALWTSSRTVRPARCKSQRIRAFDNRSFGYQTHTDPQRYDGREIPPDTRPSGLPSGSSRVGQNDGRGWLRA